MPARAGNDLALSEYAVVGDQKTAALIASDGAVDWLCCGRFDAPAVFCRILDGRRGGYFSVAPDGEASSSRCYIGNTNVLMTDFRNDSGVVRVTDFMPLGFGRESVLLRKVQGLSGEVAVRVEFVPTFDFARAQPNFTRIATGCSVGSLGSRLELSCPAPLEFTSDRATSVFSVRSGETRWLALTQQKSVSDDAAEQALSSTLAGWERWSGRGNYPGPYERILRRSALVLKLLIHADSGAMVAAPTTSLPETPGGVRNWDYRYTWLRDSSWVVGALMGLGYHEESMAFIDWLGSLDFGERAPVLYDIEGGLPTEEQELRHLRGYRGSRPVRIGNRAALQDQHDVFGEVVAAVRMCSDGMMSMRPLRPDLWRLVTALADKAEAHWPHPDRGIWEVRDRPRHFLSSKLLCWTALEGAIAIAARDGLSGPLDKWGRARDRIRERIVDVGFDADLGSFVRAFGERDLDASALLLANYGILPRRDPRLARTIEAVCRRLSAGKGLLRRYAVTDGLPGTEGAFTACSFWLVESLAHQDRVEEAKEIFECVTARANDLGLLSEQISPQTGTLLGNYPQAFTHLALIRSALAIASAENREPSSPSAASSS